MMQMQGSGAIMCLLQTEAVGEQESYCGLVGKADCGKEGSVGQTCSKEQSPEDAEGLRERGRGRNRARKRGRKWGAKGEGWRQEERGEKGAGTPALTNPHPLSFLEAWLYFSSCSWIHMTFFSFLLS